MKEKFFRSARIILTVVVMIVAASLKLYPIDSNNRYFAWPEGGTAR